MQQHWHWKELFISSTLQRSVHRWFYIPAEAESKHHCQLSAEKSSHINQRLKTDTNFSKCFMSNKYIISSKINSCILEFCRRECKESIKSNLIESSITCSETVPNERKGRVLVKVHIHATLSSLHKHQSEWLWCYENQRHGLLDHELLDQHGNATALIIVSPGTKSFIII